MPRSVSGNYTLPLPPVVANTVIQAAWANTTHDDMAQAITDSLDRFGRGGMVAPFRIVDGTAASPALAFSAETGTGLWRDGTGVLAFSVLGAKVGQWSAAGLLAGDITALNGTIQNLSVTDIICSTIDADTISATVGITAPVISSPQGEFGTLHATGVSYLQGRVGVGKIADPSYMVDVQGAIRGIGDGGAGGLRVVNAVGDSGGSFTCPVGLSKGVGISGDGGPIRFTAGGAERAILNIDGNLGIGTGVTMPAVRVHAMAPGGGARFRAQCSDPGGVIADWTADGGNGAWIGTITNHDLHFATNSGVRAVLNPLGWLSLGMSTLPAEQRNLQIRDPAGAQIILGNRTNSASQMVFGALLFDAYRDVASPSFVAGMWAEGNAPIGNNTDLVFGVQQNGGTTYPVERMRIYGFSPVGAVRIGPNTGVTTASALEVKGASNTIVVSGGSSTGYQGIRIYNDTYAASRSLEIDFSGSAWSGPIVTDGPSGEQAAIVTTAALPLTLGTANRARIVIPAASASPVLIYQNGNPYAPLLDPGNLGTIGIGSVIGAEAAGASFAGLVGGGIISLSGAATLSVYGFSPAANVVISTGQYRLLGRVSANFGIWMRTA